LVSGKTPDFCGWSKERLSRMFFYGESRLSSFLFFDVFFVSIPYYFRADHDL